GPAGTKKWANLRSCNGLHRRAGEERLAPRRGVVIDKPRRLVSGDGRDLKRVASGFREAPADRFSQTVRAAVRQSRLVAPVAEVVAKAGGRERRPGARH